jgi:hypothetical protein
MRTRTKARACDGKIRHPAKTDAEEALHQMVRAGASPQRLSTYRCGHCNGWHVGHEPPGRQWGRRRG